MKEENFLKETLDGKNPFTVPEGYFESLTDEVMRRLPQTPSSYRKPQTVTLWDRCKPLVYLAAFFCGAALLVRAASGFFSSTRQAQEVEDESLVETRLISDLLDNTMTDSYSLYLMLNGFEDEPMSDSQDMP